MAGFEIFGFEIKKKTKEGNLVSVVDPINDDGATVVNSAAAYYGIAVDLEGTVKTENDLIRRYRESAQYCDCDAAIEDIVNEAIVAESEESSVEVVLDDVKVSPAIKTKITEEFGNILKLFDFEERGHDIFRQWYIDGRIFYNIIIDPKNITNGIQELRNVDPRKIRKIKNIKKVKTPSGVEISQVEDEYFLYNDKGISEQSTQGIKLSLDSIILSTSGLVDSNANMVLSYLHKAIKPVNQLKMMEDALVIYRISRAPERRIFYIDVGNLPKQRAEQYVSEIMNKFRNKIVYDAATGEVQNNKQHLSMMEDFWMPRREGGKGTEITTLAGAQNLSDIADVNYFQNKLYQSLNVPLSRLQPQQNFSLGRSNEITRDEIKFNKFITRLRKKFGSLFKDALRVQLITKQIIRAEEWETTFRDIKFRFQKDNNFSELKEAEVLSNRIALLQTADNYIGKYFSISWVRKNILQQSEEEIKQMDKEIQEDHSKELEFATKQGEIEQAKLPQGENI
jgi:hypothetical protein